MNMITRSAVPTNLDFEAARSTLLTLRSAGVSRAAILWALRARRSELNNVVNGIQPPSPELAARLGWLVMTDQLPEPPAWGDVPVTVTFGESKWDNSTTDTQTLTVAELAEVLTDHQDGDKEGRCIRPARFRGGRRTQDDADEISILMLDSDTGQTREELEAAVERLGLLAIISSTHSHLTTETEVSAKAWTEYRTANAGGTPEKFLVIEKGYQPNVAVGATVDREAAGRVFFRHQTVRQVSRNLAACEALARVRLP